LAIKIIYLAGVKEKGRASFERLIEVLGWVEVSRQGWGRGVEAVGNEFFTKTVPQGGFTPDSPTIQC
jgi:hypothetical protein